MVDSARDFLSFVRSVGRLRLNVYNLAESLLSINLKLHTVQEEQAMAQVPQGPIECSRLAQHIQERKKKRILFKGEFLMVKKSQENHRMEYALHKENSSKNYYPETLPYDYNRVILKPVPNIPHSHYINASYVDSFYQPKAYIVAQACKTKQAAADFWRLVWEQDTNCIVMLTKVFDFMRVMCMQYWPLTKFQFGEFEIETVETRHYAHFVIRVLKISKTDSSESRLVHHFHFTEWELNGIPYISALLDFRRRVRKFRADNPCKGPIVLHCSDGGGRCGVYLAIDSNLELAEEENMVDVFGYSKILINSRQNTVDSLDHYIFIYEALLEALECSSAPFPASEILHRVTEYMKKTNKHHANETRFLYEYKLLSHLVPDLRIGDCAGGHRLENRGKNRDVMVVPPDNSRPYLSTLHGESKDYTYINAVYIDGFTRKNEFIVTEWPKPSTVDSIWALIFDHNCHTVINLSNQEDPKAYPSIVHNKGRAIYGPFLVEIMSYNVYPNLTSHMVKIMKRKRTVQPKTDVEHNLIQQTFMLTEMMMSGAALQDVEVRICCIISVTMWPLQNRVPSSTSGLIDVIKMARSWRRRAPDRPETKPAVILSHNGFSRCGIYVAANIVIDQIDMDQEIDIFHAVKLIRMNRPQLVDTKEEYKYIYDLILHYYMSMPEYKQIHSNGDILTNSTVVENHVGS